MHSKIKKSAFFDGETAQTAEILRLQGHDAKRPVTKMEIGKCPWCAAPVERREQGGHVKEFCSTAHKNLYNAGIRKLALLQARIIRTPGLLKNVTEQGYNLPTAAERPEEVSPATRRIKDGRSCGRSRPGDQGAEIPGTG